MGKDNKTIQQEWYDSRPQVIKDLYDKYKPAWYVIKVGAPYALTVPGTKVWVHSYREDGEIGVTVQPQDKQPEGLAHEQSLGIKFNKTAAEIKEINDAPVLVHIDPKWLELLVEPQWAKDWD